MSILKAQGLSKTYSVRGGWRGQRFEALADASLTLEPGRTVALVGQSGSGKSTLAKILMRLERQSSGQVILDGERAGMRGASLHSYRSHVQMVFQDPFASLNPFHTIEHHLSRPLILHGRAKNSEEARPLVRELLERVGLMPPDDIARRRPHELSGGQRQRVAIARAIAPGPSVLIADEPVSMLDVSIRLDVLNLLAEIQRAEGLAILYITHDLATARHFSDDILVMLRGKIVERGPADDVILHPQHEYTKVLLDAAPNPERTLASRL
jgi:peptide/nickel transport system ATP-binding protein